MSLFCMSLTSNSFSSISTFLSLFSLRYCFNFLFCWHHFLNIQLFTCLCADSAQFGMVESILIHCFGLLKFIVYNDIRVSDVMLDEEFGKSCLDKVDPKGSIPLMLSACSTRTHSPPPSTFSSTLICLVFFWRWRNV